MDDELGTDPELLWRLLLAQHVYDELIQNSGNINFNTVAERYRAHPLLPHNAPLLSDGATARTVYQELLAEYKIEESDELLGCQKVAEPLYAAFHGSLLEQMKGDVAKFEQEYRRLEVDEDFPKDERLGD